MEYWPSSFTTTRNKILGSSNRLDIERPGSLKLNSSSHNLTDRGTFGKRECSPPVSQRPGKVVAAGQRRCVFLRPVIFLVVHDAGRADPGSSDENPVYADN
jgi:hypothetical protein